MASTWYGDFIGLAYRYYDLRMNLVPLFNERKTATHLWRETIHWWGNSLIKVRFVEDVDQYWFIMGGESVRPETNTFFYKKLNKSEHYERFKRGYGDEAYLRFGVYAVKLINQVKDDAICKCTHEADDHNDKNNDSKCLYDDCNCVNFQTFQVNLLKKKKTITDIKFLTKDQIKEDPLTWNYFNSQDNNSEK